VGVVANVAVNLDARGVQQQLKAIRQTSVGAADGFKKLEDRAKAVKAIVEAQQGGFAKASTVQGVFAAKVRNTEQAIKAQISALRDVQSKVQLGGAIYQKAAKQIADYERVLRQANQTQEQNAQSGNRLGGVIRGLVGVYAASRTIQFVFGQAAEIEKQTRSLEVLVGSAEKARDIVKQLQDIGAVTPFTSTELIESAKRLQAFGVDTEKVVETTRRLADVSGATGAELQGLVTAYGQVQAKGRLQGEELLQFQERGVALQKVLKEEYKLSGDEFQKALSKGQISAEAVEYAVRKLTDAGGKYANGAIAQSDTLAGKLSTLQDSFQRLAQNIGKFFEPVFKFLIEGITRFINRLNDATVMQDEITARNQAIEEARAKFGRFNVFAEGRGQFIAEREKAIFDQLRGGRSTAAPKAPTITGGNPPPLLGGTNGDGAKKTANEAKKLADELARSLQTGNQLFTQFSRQAVLIGETSEIERKRLQIQYDYQDRAEQIAELKNTEQQINLSQINDEIRRLELLELQTEELEKQVKKAQELTDEIIKGMDFGVEGQDTIAGGIGKAITDLQDQLNPIKLATQAIVTGATAIGDAFSTAFGEVITGSKSVREALSDAFKKIGEAFISMALEIIAKQMTLIILQTIFNALSGAGGFQKDLSDAGKGLSGKGALSPGKMFPSGVFAEGGFVTGPTNALIGEGGEPEYVIPQSKMRGAMNRYAAGARGSAVIPSGGGEGGMGGTATAAPAAIDVRYTVERINSVDYVTADQFQTGMQQAAQQGAAQGEQRTLRRLQMSTSTRKRLGM